MVSSRPVANERRIDTIKAMEQAPQGNQNTVTILSCDGDLTLREGDWLRLWNGVGIGIALDVWVGTGGTVYENSGPGGRRTKEHVR